MTDLTYYQRRREIRRAIARGDFSCASRALYKLLVHAIEIDDPHVVDYAWVKRALAVLAKGPKFDPRSKYFNPDGSITLEAADLFCNYTSVAVTLLYANYLTTGNHSPDVLVALRQLECIFGENATPAHIRRCCFERIFDVDDDNVIRWNGSLFIDLQMLSHAKGDQTWLVNLLYSLLLQQQDELVKTRTALYSANKKIDELVKALNREIHYTPPSIEFVEALCLEIRELRIDLMKHGTAIGNRICRYLIDGEVEKTKRQLRTPAERKMIEQAYEMVLTAKRNGNASPNVSEICRIVFNRWEKPVDSIDSPEKLREKLRYDKGL